MDIIFNLGDATVNLEDISLIIGNKAEYYRVHLKSGYSFEVRSRNCNFDKQENIFCDRDVLTKAWKRATLGVVGL